MNTQSIIPHLNNPVLEAERLRSRYQNDISVLPTTLLERLLEFWAEESEIVNDDFADISSRSIVEYLSKSHQLYLEVMIPEIISYLPTISKQGPSWLKAELLGFMQRYTNDVIEHFEYEEQELFPLLIAMEDSDDIGQNRSISLQQLTRYEEAHAELHEELSELIRTLDTYISTLNSPSMELRMLTEKLRSFYRDISLHEALEHHVLLPRMVAMAN